MVVALGPGKFYGKSLPRPRIYTDVKFSDIRVDPPAPVMDPLMSWAEEAHWSMGGLSFTRHRLQGKIEGNISKLRAEHEKMIKNDKNQKKFTRSVSPSPPPAPIAVKRKRRLIDEDEEEDEGVRRGRTARKLGDDFDRVAYESGLIDGEGAIAGRTRGRTIEKPVADKTNGLKRPKKGVKGSEKSGKKRSSPRLETPRQTRSSQRLAKRESP